LLIRLCRFQLPLNPALSSRVRPVSFYERLEYQHALRLELVRLVVALKLLLVQRLQIAELTYEDIADYVVPAVVSGERR
jgi:hypothetical protein